MRNFDMNRKKFKKKGISIIEQVYYYNCQAVIFLCFWFEWSPVIQQYKRLRDACKWEKHILYKWWPLGYLHVDINILIKLDICLFFSSGQFCKQICRKPKILRSQNLNFIYLLAFVFNIEYRIMNINKSHSSRLTIMSSNSLDSCWEGQGFSDCQLCNMKIILIGISSRFLGYKLIHPMTIISHLSRKLMK